MTWRAQSAPIVRWGGVLIGLLLAVSAAWATVKWFVRPGKTFPSLVIYLYAVVFGLLLVVAELEVWPAIATYFGFLKLGSGRAWFLLFISTLCLSGSLSAYRGQVDHILLSTAGVCGIVLAFLGLIIRNEPAVLNRAPADVPPAVAGVFNRGGASGGHNGAPARGGPDVEI